MFIAVLSGLVTGLSLIVAIGAQNAFVLRQGLRRSHVLLVVAVCAFSDLVLILAGVAGIGTLIERAPGVLTVVRWAGAAFLLGYGLLAARRAARGGHLEAAADRQLSTRAALATALAFTWLNPHVYLDTVLLVGSIANAHGPSGRWWFAAGAGVASLGWFTALGFGARALTPMFRRPNAWRVLDGGYDPGMLPDDTVPKQPSSLSQDTVQPPRLRVRKAAADSPCSKALFGRRRTGLPRAVWYRRRDARPRRLADRPDLGGQLTAAR